MNREKIEKYEAEILDSDLFINTLEKKLKALKNSMDTRQTLGEIPLSICPQCFKPLLNHIDENHCVLCKEPIIDSDDISHASRMWQEISLQISESKRIYKRKVEALYNLKSELQPLIVKARALQKELDIAIKEFQSTRDEKLDELLTKKGEFTSNIFYLNQDLKITNTLLSLENELIQHEINIKKLERDIQLASFKQRENLKTALFRIEKITKYLLNKDLKRQDEFENPNKIEIDFLDDAFNVDGKYNFSASSNTYLKNSIRFSIFFASTTEDFFRYPRFILCDNIEDKGMEQIRSQNFQKQIVNLSEHSKTTHQIIFTTSMIDADLNLRNDLVIGEFYNKANKTLKIPI